MEDAFKKLQAESRNSVDGLVSWIKEAKLIESTKAGEEKARALFADVADKNNVDLEKFKQIVTKLAKEQHKSFEDLSKQLVKEAPRIQNALAAGVNAFKDAMKR